MNNTASPEIAVLLCCGRAELADTYRERLHNLLAGPIDWERLRDLAHRHKMVPLLHRHLSALGTDKIPASAWEQLTQQASANSEQAARLTQELTRLVTRFQANGINALALKGPTLAQSLYGSHDLRQFGDLDLWIHWTDIPRACDLLTTRGCRLTSPLERPAAGRSEAAFLRFGSEYNYSFLLPDLRQTLELHWLPAPRHFGTPLQFAESWERRSACTLDGVCIPTLGNADQLVFLAAHGAKHQWTAIEWLAGFAEQAARLDGAEWKQAWAIARKSHFTRALELALTLAERWLDAKAAPHKSPAVERLVQQLDTRLLAGETRQMPALDLAVFRLRVRESPKDRLVCFAYFLFGSNSRDLDTFSPQHRSLLPALLARPLRLIRKYKIHAPMTQSLSFHDSDIFQVSGQQATADFADETVILQIEQGVYYSLNAVGAFVWQRLAQPVSVGQLRDAVVEEYDTNAAQVETDLHSLLQDLHRHGLIEAGRPR